MSAHRSVMKAPKIGALLVAGLAVVLPTVLAIGPAVAPLSGNDCTRGNITVPGVGTATFSKPDEAQIVVLVSTFNFTATAARDAAANTAERVIQAILKVPGVLPDSITTTALSVLPEHEEREVIGYDFSHEIQVGVSNPTDTLVASVLDTAVDAGRNSIAIKSVSFSLSEELSSDKAAESRRVAANDALKTARQLTGDMGVTLGPILSMRDTTLDAALGSVKLPNDATAVKSVSSAPKGSTPIAVANLRIDTSIQVVFGIC